jgi:hypothetical protein
MAGEADGVARIVSRVVQQGGLGETDAEKDEHAKESGKRRRGPDANAGGWMGARCE